MENKPAKFFLKLKITTFQILEMRVRNMNTRQFIILNTVCILIYMSTRTHMCGVPVNCNGQFYPSWLRSRLVMLSSRHFGVFGWYVILQQSWTTYTTPSTDGKKTAKRYFRTSKRQYTRVIRARAHTYTHHRGDVKPGRITGIQYETTEPFCTTRKSNVCRLQRWIIFSFHSSKYIFSSISVLLFLFCFVSFFVAGFCSRCQRNMIFNYVN